MIESTAAEMTEHFTEFPAKVERGAARVGGGRGWNGPVRRQDWIPANGAERGRPSDEAEMNRQDSQSLASGTMQRVTQSEKVEYRSVLGNLLGYWSGFPLHVR